MADDQLLITVAGRIADGELVDWSSVSSTLPSTEAREIADELALVAQIAAGHRQLHQLLPMASDTPPNLMPDRARWGHLDLLNVVGRGSYGIVYRAWDTRLERLVALKLFHGAANPDEVMQEGRMLARMRQENVVTVYGADVLDGVAGIWMELVHGKTLDNIVKGAGPMTPREAALVGADVARALAAVHGAGLLHCDVKAQNVVRETTGRVVLMDLGAGRLAPEARDTDYVSDVAGTPRYMAPELFHAGSTSSRATDIYSLGVLLYHLVTGKFPIDGRTIGELRKAHESGAMNELASARRDLPARFASLVSRMLSRDAAQRPESAAEIQAELSAIAADPQPAPAPRPLGWWAFAAAAALAAGVYLSRPAPAPPAAPAPVIRSIAVLPIKNLTGDSAKAYIADGLTELLISNLARIQSLRVPSSLAVREFRDSSQPPAEIARTLGVQLLLAGSITQADSRVRLSVHVIGQDGAALWGEDIDRESTGVIAAQAQIASHIAQRFALNSAQLLPAGATSFSAEAQDAYLRGLALANGGPAQALESAKYFRDAVEREPAFAAAWAELATLEGRYITSSAGIDRNQHAAFSREMAERAIALDPALAAAHAALANVLFYYDWDFPAADRAFQKALEVGPSNTFARQRYAMFLAAMSRTDQALAVAEEGRVIEPANPARAHAVGFIHYYRREYDLAMQKMREAIALSPAYPVAHFGAGRIFAALGRHDDAIAAINKALESGRTAAYLIELARVYAAAGRRDEQRRVMAEITDREKAGDSFNLDNLAYIAAAEGRIDDAFRILEDARAQKMVNMLWLAVDPRVDVLRSDPRFDQLLHRMKLIP